MITVFGEGRGFRVIWLLEELGLSYRLKSVNLMESPLPPEFLAVNPAGFIPAIQDGDVTMVESIAIMEYLMARFGPTLLAPTPDAPAFPLYKQFLHMGEAGLAMPINVVVATKILAPEDDRDNTSTRWASDTFKSRLGLVRGQLARADYMAGNVFTAADISVTYALEFAERTVGFMPDDKVRDYIKRTTGREAYARAMDSCAATKAWAADIKAQQQAKFTNEERKVGHG